MRTTGNCHERRCDWRLRQFVQGIESRLRVSDLDEFAARLLMQERMVPRHVQEKIIDRVGLPVSSFRIPLHHRNSPTPA